MDDERTQWRGLVETASFTVLFAAILLGVILFGAISWNRGFQVDEVEHIHAAYNMADGRVLYRDFWQGHPPLLYVLVEPFIDVHDPEGSFHRARLVSGAMLIALLALVGACAWKLGGRTAALVAVALAITHTTLIERGMEVRPDGGYALCTVLALAIELSGISRPLPRRCLAAAVLGSGFLFTQKAIFATFAFGCLWLFDAWRARRARDILLPVLCWFVPLLTALGVMLLFGCAEAFVRQNIVDAFFAGIGARGRGRFSPMPGLIHEAGRNVMFYLLAAGGTVYAALAARTLRHRELAFTAFLAAVLFASMWANPFPWPYVHVHMLPLLSIAGAVGIAAFAEKSRSVAPAAVAVVLVMLTSVPRLVSKAVPSTAEQFAVLRETQRATAPDDRLFDLVGLYFRPDAYPDAYAMSGELIRSYESGKFRRIVPVLMQNRCAGVMLNYRTAVLGIAERRFFTQHFVGYWGNLFLPGIDLSEVQDGTTVPFEVLKAKVFRYEGSGAISVDSRRFTHGMLALGVHLVHVDSAAAPARLIVATPPPIPPPAPPANLYVNFD